MALAGDRGDHADRLAEPLQHRPLLDVDLDVAEQVVARGNRPRPPAHEVAEPHALVVAELEPRRVEAAGQGRRAEVGSAEAHALLVRKPDDLDRALHPLDGLEGDQHPERPVVPPGIDHRVQVRAEHQHRPVAAPADQVAERVLAHLETGLAHPAADQRVGLPHGVGPEAAGEPALLLAHLRETVAALQHARRGVQLPRYVL